MAEPEIMGEEAAWRVGKDRVLAVQTCEDGYDYTLFDENYNDIDGGQIDNLDMTMLEIRRDILESYNLENREIRVMVYDEVMEQAFRSNSFSDFVKSENYLKNAEIAYTFTDGWVRKLGVKNLKIYLNGNNLWVWSKMPDDRESNFAGSGNQGAYPTVKRFNLGVKFTL